MMRYIDILSTLEAYAAKWSGDIPVQYPNQPNINPDGNWMRMDVLPGETMTTEVGRGAIDSETGLVRFQIFTKEGKGWYDAFHYADLIGLHMAHKRLSGTLWTRAYTPMKIDDSDGWYRVGVDVPYRA